MKTSILSSCVLRPSCVFVSTRESHLSGRRPARPGDGASRPTRKRPRTFGADDRTRLGGFRSRRRHRARPKKSGFFRTDKPGRFLLRRNRKPARRLRGRRGLTSDKKQSVACSNPLLTKPDPTISKKPPYGGFSDRRYRPLVGVARILHPPCASVNFYFANAPTPRSTARRLSTQRRPQGTQ